MTEEPPQDGQGDKTNPLKLELLELKEYEKQSATVRLEDIKRLRESVIQTRRELPAFVEEMFKRQDKNTDFIIKEVERRIASGALSKKEGEKKLKELIKSAKERRELRERIKKNLDYYEKGDVSRHAVRIRLVQQKTDGTLTPLTDLKMRLLTIYEHGQQSELLYKDGDHFFFIGRTHKGKSAARYLLFIDALETHHYTLLEVREYHQDITKEEKGHASIFSGMQEHPRGLIIELKNTKTRRKGNTEDEEKFGASDHLGATFVLKRIEHGKEHKITIKAETKSGASMPGVKFSLKKQQLTEEGGVEIAEDQVFETGDDGLVQRNVLSHERYVLVAEAEGKELVEWRQGEKIIAKEIAELRLGYIDKDVALTAVFDEPDEKRDVMLTFKFFEKTEEEIKPSERPIDLATYIFRKEDLSWEEATELKKDPDWKKYKDGLPVEGGELKFKVPHKFRNVPIKFLLAQPHNLQITRVHVNGTEKGATDFGDLHGGEKFTYPVWFANIEKEGNVESSFIVNPCDANGNFQRINEQSISFIVGDAPEKHGEPEPTPEPEPEQPEPDAPEQHEDKKEEEAIENEEKAVEKLKKEDDTPDAPPTWMTEERRKVLNTVKEYFRRIRRFEPEIFDEFKNVYIKGEGAAKSAKVFHVKAVEIIMNSDDFKSLSSEERALLGSLTNRDIDDVMTSFIRFLRSKYSAVREKEREKRKKNPGQAHADKVNKQLQKLDALRKKKK